jgi:hypothetical protein
MPVPARSVEQAIPRAATLDRGGKTARRESEREMVTLFNAGPRSLSAPSAHPPGQGWDRPRAWLTERNWWCWPSTSQDQKQRTLILRQGAREWSEATRHLALTGKSTGEKQGVA